MTLYWGYILLSFPKRFCSFSIILIYFRYSLFLWTFLAINVIFHTQTFQTNKLIVFHLWLRDPKSTLYSDTTHSYSSRFQKWHFLNSFHSFGKQTRSLSFLSFYFYSSNNDQINNHLSFLYILHFIFWFSISWNFILQKHDQQTQLSITFFLINDN